jgi:hypothetical protein
MGFGGRILLKLKTIVWKKARGKGRNENKGS